MRTRVFLFGGVGNAPATDVGLLLHRVVVGLMLALAHGWGKVPPSEGFVGMVGGLGVPAPGVLAWVAAAAEFGGGLLIALGLLTRPAAALVVIHFTIVVLVAHAGDPFGQRELAFLFWASALLWLFAGAGRHSLDAVLRDRKR